MPVAPPEAVLGPEHPELACRAGKIALERGSSVLLMKRPSRAAGRSPMSSRPSDIIQAEAIVDADLSSLAG
jgi:hypothetical protein